MPNSLKIKALRVLSLPDNFEPATKVAHIFGGITLEEIVSCLRTSTDETCMFICANYDRLIPEQRNRVDIDILIAASKCRDPFKVAGQITELYSRAKAMETQVRAATNSPQIMEKRAKFAKSKDGHNDAKLILQTMGVAPVPQNQKTYIFGNRIDNSKNFTVNAPQSHEQIVGDVGRILGTIAADVPLGEDPKEDRGDRESAED